MIMESNNIKVKFKEFSLPPTTEHDSSVIIPTIRGLPFFKYGVHAYYFMNFKTSKGLCLTINHKDIILPGLTKFLKANHKTYRYFHQSRSLLQRYHCNFNFLEQIMLMTVPHTVTHIKNGRFLVNLWSYFGNLDIDCKNHSVKYTSIEEKNDDHVLGSQQFYDAQNDELYYMSYSLKDSLKRIDSPEQKVFCKILKRENRTGNTKDIWSGELVDYLHDILINKTRQYCVVCELGLYKDKENNIIPSKVLVLDLKNNRSWVISRFIVAAHAQFDPDEPDIIYFSNHNFNFEHSNIFKLLKNSTYDVKFRGPASVYKYRLTSQGPEELGVFTKPDFFRLTNFHIFHHRGQKILAAIGSPNFIFIADAENMNFIKKIEVNHHITSKNTPCIIGTISPSIDGEKIYVQTTKSFQMVDISSGKPDMMINYSYDHSCTNHMLTSHDTDW
jgi:hypothetical protein